MSANDFNLLFYISAGTKQAWNTMSTENEESRLLKMQQSPHMCFKEKPADIFSGLAK